MIKYFHIFDFDGTLVDSSHRYRMNADTGKIDLEYWIANEHRAENDSPLPMFETFRHYQAHPEHYPIIATARVWDSHSVKFAAKHGITCPIIARRNRSDSRGGAELKIQGLKPFFNLRQFLNVKHVYVYEDNLSYLEKLVSAFRNTVGVYIPSVQGH